MANSQFISDQIGALGDTLAVVLNGERVVTAESWEHTEGILSQPCGWSMRLGWGDVARGLLQQYPKGTPFELYIGSARQATGKIDGVGADQPEGGATTLTINGRDALAKLHDSYVEAEVGVNVSTYADLAWHALQQVGIAPSGKPIDPTILQVDNNANRQIKTGVPVIAILPHRTPEEILENAELGGPSAGAVHTVPQARLNETWHQFLRRYLDRAGLMFWAGADGSFVLGAPNGNQAATYNLVRRTGQPKQGANVVGCKYKDDATHRHTEAVIYGRGGGRILGRVKSKGKFVDQELLDAGYTKQAIVYRDAQVHSTAEAAYFARRKLAEERRGGWTLEYTIAGLTLPFAGNGNARAVLVPDTVVAVQDDELGLSDNYYIETVTRRRAPQTQTTIRLMRIGDLVFGGPGTGTD